MQAVNEYQGRLTRIRAQFCQTLSFIIDSVEVALPIVRHYCLLSLLYLATPFYRFGNAVARINLFNQHRLEADENEAELANSPGMI